MGASYNPINTIIQICQMCNIFERKVTDYFQQSIATGTCNIINTTPDKIEVYGT